MLVFCSLITTFIQSQNVDCNGQWWIGFGSNKFIMDFTQDPIGFYQTTAQSNGAEGTAAYTNRDGSLWFATDGQRLFDFRISPPALISDTLGRNSGSQPALIVRITDTKFFIFVTVLQNDSYPSFQYVTLDATNTLAQITIPLTLLIDRSFQE